MVLDRENSMEVLSKILPVVVGPVDFPEVELAGYLLCPFKLPGKVLNIPRSFQLF